MRLRSGKWRTRSAKDAFDSIGYLAQARADGEDARSEELLAVAEKGSPADWLDFARQARSLANSTSADEISQTYSAASKPTFKGLLGDELRNITYAGEQDAANAELHAYGAFLAAVQRERRLADAGNFQGAVGAAVSPGLNSTEGYAQAMDSAIATTEKINQDQFDLIRDQAFAALNLPSLAFPWLAIAILGLSAWGIRQRAAEYTAT